jgi:hypothetical protein
MGNAYPKLNQSSPQGERRRIQGRVILSSLFEGMIY